MVSIGYTIMGEQAGPKQLVADAVRAEEAGFDFITASDHYFPWLDEQGHSPYVWSVLGAVAQVTKRAELMTFVTCPIIRYHPAVVAQKAATMQLLSDGRFTLGLGSGEHLNEHVVGSGWPPVDVRHAMLVEAIEIIRALFAGETVTYRGDYLEAENAKLWDLPDEPPKIGIAVSGPQSCDIAGKYADLMIAVEPKSELGDRFDAAGGAGKPRVGQVGISYDRDEAAARKRAYEQFKWSVGSWDVMAELPSPRHFASAATTVTEDDVAKQVSCGPDIASHIASVKKFVDAGFTHVSVTQVGGDAQDGFFDDAADVLLAQAEKLKKAAARGRSAA